MGFFKPALMGQGPRKTPSYSAQLTPLLSLASARGRAAHGALSMLDVNAGYPYRRRKMRGLWSLAKQHVGTNKQVHARFMRYFR